MNDLYIRPQEENTDILEVNDPISIFVEQIEVLFFTQPGEVLGEPDMGIDLERYVHELNLNEYDIVQKIDIQIKKYAPLAETLPYEVDVFFAKTADSRDAALINVTIEKSTIIGIVL